MATDRWFYWMPTQKGKGAPVLYETQPTDGNDKSTIKDFLFEHHLIDDEINLTFDDLKKKYPCPEINNGK